MRNDLWGTAVIGDVLGSRSQKDGTDWHRSLVAALNRVNEQVTAVQPLAPTVGDEFQGLYSSPSAALWATMLVRLELDDGLDCRFGVGVGFYSTIGEGALPIQAGTAWWSAREAIVTGALQESVRQPTLRTWYRCEPDENLPGTPLAEGPTNAYLLARDHIVTQMGARTRRLLLGIIKGETQSEIARREGIIQSAVSRNLRRNGAYALLEGAELLEGSSDSLTRGT